MQYLNGKVSWVTGAAGSIGKATSIILAQAGSHLVISDKDETRLTELELELGTYGIDVLPLPLDVSERSAVAKVKNQILNKYGRLDVLVNGAGISPKGKKGRIAVEDLSIEEWYRVMDVNLNGAFFCSQIAIKLMKSQGSGHIVNISSQAGRSYSAITGAHYAVSKAGLISLTRQMAGELGTHGIYVNAVAPGRIATPMIRDVPEEVNQKIIKDIPLQRIGTPEEVAKVILFLVTEQSSYITGAVIDINGGRLMV